MTRNECLRVIFAIASDTPIVFTTGYTCRDAYALCDKESNFYMVGSMGLAGSIGIGVALSTGLDTIVVDGDGSLLMNPGNLFLAANLSLNNFIHIVLDNKCYESTGRQMTISGEVDFAHVAILSGYRSGWKVTNLADFEKYIKQAITRKNGPTLIHAVISSDLRSVAPRISIPLRDVSGRFREFLKYKHASLQKNWCVDVHNRSSAGRRSV